MYYMYYQQNKALKNLVSMNTFCSENWHSYTLNLLKCDIWCDEWFMKKLILVL